MEEARNALVIVITCTIISSPAEASCVGVVCEQVRGSLSAVHAGEGQFL